MQGDFITKTVIFSSPYRWSLSRDSAIFFNEIKKNRRITGRRCRRCKKVIVPPSGFCEFCFGEMGDFLVVGSGGYITAIARREGNPLALIKLDGADTSLLHIVKDGDSVKADIGSYVRAEFSDQPQGNILDFSFHLSERTPEDDGYPFIITPEEQPEELMELKGELEIVYNHSYGIYRKFYEGLKEGKIYAVRCSACKKVFLPPRPFCSLCFADTEKDWVRISDTGYVKSFTEVRIPFVGQPTKPPYIYALIVLDGTDSEFHHRVAGIAEKDLFIGMRVRAVWKAQRTGSIHDIAFFECAEKKS